MYKKLKHSYKKKYPFSLSVPSFIYPAGYEDNVKMLGPFVDEVELLFMSGEKEEYLPDNSLIERLQVLSRIYDIKYNIHLPTAG